MTSSLSCDYIPIMECKNEYTISLPTPEYIAVCHSLSDSDTRMDIISLESNDRNFKRAAKLLTSMLDPRNGKVKFRVFGYVRFGHLLPPPSELQTSDLTLGWTSLVKEKDQLCLSFIDIKDDDMEPTFLEDINADTTLEIISQMEVIFHFKKTSFHVILNMEMEIDYVIHLVVKYTKRCFNKAIKMSKSRHAYFVSRPVLIKVIKDNYEEKEEDMLTRNRPSTPVIPHTWRSKYKSESDSISLDGLHLKSSSLSSYSLH